MIFLTFINARGISENAYYSYKRRRRFINNRKRINVLIINAGGVPLRLGSRFNPEEQKSPQSIIGLINFAKIFLF